MALGCKESSFSKWTAKGKDRISTTWIQLGQVLPEKKNTKFREREEIRLLGLLLQKYSGRRSRHSERKTSKKVDKKE